MKNESGKTGNSVLYMRINSGSAVMPVRTIPRVPLHRQLELR